MMLEKMSRRFENVSKYRISRTGGYVSTSKVHTSFGMTVTTAARFERVKRTTLVS